MKKPRLRPTDVPEKVIALHAKIFWASAPLNSSMAFSFKGDNVFFPVPVDEVGRAWIWARGDEEDNELDEIISACSS